MSYYGRKTDAAADLRGSGHSDRRKRNIEHQSRAARFQQPLGIGTDELRSAMNLLTQRTRPAWKTSGENHAPVVPPPKA